MRLGNPESNYDAWASVNMHSLFYSATFLLCCVNGRNAVPSHAEISQSAKETVLLKSF